VLQQAARCGGTEIIEFSYPPVLDMEGLRSMKHSRGTGVGQIARIVGCLLKTGASPEPAIKGRCYYHHEYVFESRMRVLDRAAKTGKLGIFRTLLDASARVTARTLCYVDGSTFRGYNALKWAVYNGDRDRKPLSNGAKANDDILSDHNDRGNTVITALQIASWKSNTELV